MKEYKCPECGEWKKGSGIAMHIWNSHRLKYKEMTVKCEEREIIEPITTESINKEEYVLEPVKGEYTAINKVEQEKLQENNNEKKTNKEKADTTSTSSSTPATATNTPKVMNEIFRPYNIVVKPDIFDDGEVINEWC